MRDDSYTDQDIALAQRLHATGLRREHAGGWRPGDRLIGGEPPVRVVQSVSVEGEPLVEVERGGRIQTVGVAHPRVWVPSITDGIQLLGAMGCEGALMFQAARCGFKYRLAGRGHEYRLITGDSPLNLVYQALLLVLENGSLPPQSEGPGSREAVAG